MLAYYRLRAGYNPSTLAMQALTMSSDTISKIERGERGIGRGAGGRRQALRLAKALKLDPWETDHFLWVAGYAPVLDWQQFARDILVDLGLGSVYEEDSAALYEAQAARDPARPEEAADDD